MKIEMTSETENNIKQIIFCCNFAAFKHKDQRRISPGAVPYINHPIGVANILCNEAGISDLNVVQAAVLHDTVEDTDTTLQEIEEVFGSTVAGLVAEVTDDKTLPKQARKDAQIEHAPHSSNGAKLVKLADKLHNLRDLEKEAPVGWSAERVQEYFEWSFKVVSGLKGTNAIMESKLSEIFERRNIGKL